MSGYGCEITIYNHTYIICNKLINRHAQSSLNVSTISVFIWVDVCLFFKFCAHIHVSVPTFPMLTLNTYRSTLVHLWFVNPLVASFIATRKGK